MSLTMIYFSYIKERAYTVSKGRKYMEKVNNILRNLKRRAMKGTTPMNDLAISYMWAYDVDPITMNLIIAKYNMWATKNYERTITITDFTCYV